MLSANSIIEQPQLPALSSEQKAEYALQGGEYGL
jgi:hypothetical protein